MSRKKKAYIAGPISKGCLLRNVNQATAAFVALAKAGLAPFCPHWSAYSKEAFFFPGVQSVDTRVFCEATRFGNTEMTHADWMGVDLPWVEVSDAVLRLPGESTGADLEVTHAIKCGIPVFYDIEELIAWSKA